MSIFAARTAAVDTASDAVVIVNGIPAAGRRKGGPVENREFCGFARRIIRAFARRVAGGDVEALRDLVNLRHNLDAAIDDAVVGLRAHGYSWDEIADRLGVTKQAAWGRWSKICKARLTADLSDEAIEREIALIERAAA